MSNRKIINSCTTASDCLSKFHLFLLPWDAGIYNCGSTIIREEGVRSLWKGLTPFATHLCLKYFLRFGTNALYQGALRDKVCSPLR